MKQEHGGNIFEYDIAYDFSANLNPLGMPESVIKAACAAVSESDKYPDPYCRELTRRLSEHEKVCAENIVCGNGADDLIYRIAHGLKPKKAVIAVPTFSEYVKALSEVGCFVSEYAPEQIPGAITNDTDMLILCNPNNPTGQLIQEDTLKAVCGRCAERNTVFLCDECFIDLCENGEKRSARRFMNENTIVLKAFTKTYAMAGLRLGYALFGNAELAAKVRNSGQYWSVSAPAQAAGIAALDETQYITAVRKLIADERKYLSGMLESHGFTVYPSDANFILFRCDLPLDELLLKEKILIRSCGNYSGLDEGYYRVAVRSHEENEALADAIERVMKWQKR